MKTMRISCDDMHQAIMQHLQSQILRRFAKPPGQGAGRKLNPHPGSNQPIKPAIGRPQPCQPFGMRENGDIARGEQFILGGTT